MKIGNSFMLLFFSTWLFISALVSSIYLFTETINVIDQGFVIQKKMDKKQFQTLKITEANNMSGAQVLMTLNINADIDCEIVVNGRLFPKGVDIKEVNISDIDVKKTFKREIVRDSEGNTTQIIFTQI